MGPFLFADTSFYIARLWPRDSHHARAVAWQNYVIKAGLRLVTTEAVLWELLNAFSAASTREFAFQAYESIHAEPQIEVVGFDATRVRAALQLYNDRRDKSWGITDCYSFVLMRERVIAEALTIDHHFEQAGFVSLLLRDPS